MESILATDWDERLAQRVVIVSSAALRIIPAFA